MTGSNTLAATNMGPATTLPTGARGRWLALAWTLTVAAALWFGAVAPVTAWYADRNDLLERRTVLARRMAAVAATLPALRAEQNNRQTAAPPVAAVLSGGSDAIASAALQGLVQDMAGAAGISLTRIETLPADPRGDYRRIALRLALSTPLPDLVKFLVAVKRADPQLLIDDVQLRSNPALMLEPGESRAVEPIDGALTILAFRPVPAAGK